MISRLMLLVLCSLDRSLSKSVPSVCFTEMSRTQKQEQKDMYLYTHDGGVGRRMATNVDLGSW